MKSESRSYQRGMALISGLLLLLVLTILGISMFRSYGMQARIAGNTRDKQRALHAAESVQQYAEWWVSAPGGGNATQGNPCSGVVAVADPTLVTVCSNQLDPGSVVAGPWTAGSNKAVGFTYTLPGMDTTGTGADTYSLAPLFYIAYLNGSYDKQSGTLITNYQVDAAGYGGAANTTTNTVAVVESTYQVKVTYTEHLTNEKFYSLTGP